MKKRLLSTLLALCMLLALLPPGTALAVDPEPDLAKGFESELAEGIASGEKGGIVPLASDDLTPPVVTGIFMNSPGGTVTVGDTLYFDVSVEDESSITDATLGFSLITADEQNSNTIFTSFVSYDVDSCVVKVSLSIEDNVASGTWILSYINIHDYYGNSAIHSSSTAEVDFESIKFTVIDTPEDNTAPVVTAIHMDNPGGTVTVGDTLYFDVSVEDESSITGATLGFSLITADEQNSNTIFTDFVSYDVDSCVVKVSLSIEDNVASGTWILSYINIHDYYGNSVLHSMSTTEIDFESFRFIVIGTSNDNTAPVVTSIRMDNPGGTFTAGDILYFDIAVEDESSITAATLGFSPVSGDQQNSNTIFARFTSYDEDNRVVRVSLSIEDNTASGTWGLYYINIHDYYGNSLLISTSTTDIAFKDVKFTVASHDILPTSVSIPASIEVSVRSVYTIRPEVEPVESIPVWTWTSADPSIATVNSSGGGVSCLVTGVSQGVTTIIGVTQNNLTASCVVTVNDAPLPESGTIDANYQVDVGGYVDIVPVLTPPDATTLYEVSSDNPHVAGIATTGGHTGVRVIGNNPGTATITIRGANNLVMTTTVRVGKETDTQHEKRTVEGYPAICNRAGWTDSVVCSACQYVFAESQEIPATGQHAWGGWRVVQAATSTATGLKERYCEACWERETETIPATGGSSSGGSNGSGGSSGNSSGSNRPGNVTSDGQSIQASVKNGTAEITDSDANISSILDGAEDGAVHIDASAYDDVTEVSIPKRVVDAISESEVVSGLSITTSAGAVELHEEALKTLSNAMTGSKDTVSLDIKTIDVSAIPSTQKYPIADVLNTAVFINLSAVIQHKDANGRTVSTETIREFGGGVTVSIPYELPANMEGRQIIACHIADDGTITYFPVKYENGVAVFTTTHFSIFAVVDSRAAAFTDIDISAWYMSAVEYAVSKGLMVGTSTSAFGPGITGTRGMLLTILWRQEGSPVVSGAVGFEDVASGAYYAEAVRWCVSAGIAAGYSDSAFGPDDPITREQLVTILYRYAVYKGRNATVLTENLGAFTDADRLSAYAVQSMNWAVGNEIISGKGDGVLDPGGQTTRAEFAQILMRYLEDIS